MTIRKESSKICQRFRSVANFWEKVPKKLIESWFWKIVHINFVPLRLSRVLVVSYPHGVFAPFNTMCMPGVARLLSQCFWCRHIVLLQHPVLSIARFYPFFCVSQWEQKPHRPMKTLHLLAIILPHRLVLSTLLFACRCSDGRGRASSADGLLPATPPIQPHAWYVQDLQTTSYVENVSLRMCQTVRGSVAGLTQTRQNNA